ncbi:acetyl-CoA acetyltransferase [Paenibacillus tarimensis]
MENQVRQQVIYEADPQYVQTLRTKKDKLGKALEQCMHQKARIQTINGQTYEGTISGTDGLFVYIRTIQPLTVTRAFFYPPYYYQNVILPLVLFDLLAITLLYP